MDFLKKLRESRVSKDNPLASKENSVATTIFATVICVAFTLAIILFYIVGPGGGQGGIVGIEQVAGFNEEARQIPITEGTISVKGASIYYREAKPLDNSWRNKAEVLLLHGSRYTSSTWKGLGTLQILAKNHYRAVAIDLPRYGFSKKAPEVNFVETAAVVAWMKELIEKLDMRSVVLVVPSISGGYGLPLLIYPKGVDLLAMIAIAPSRSQQFSANEYKKVTQPVMLMFGELDNTEYADYSKHFLKNIPNFIQVMIPKGEHAAFVGNRLQFHQELLAFLEQKCSLGGNSGYSDYDFSKTDDYLEEFNDDNVNVFNEEWGEGEGQDGGEYWEPDNEEYPEENDNRGEEDDEEEEEDDEEEEGEGEENEDEDD